MSGPGYIGRFAPSPTGPLHFGSLIAALGGYLQARSKNGKWLLRIEDIDPPREIPGSADAIQRALEGFGLTWDDAVLYQSTRLESYRAVVEGLLERDQAFRCRCTRQTVERDSGGRYCGRCRQAQVAATEDHSVRILTDSLPIRFDDALQGTVEQRLEETVGDYVIQRRDGLYAYQLAVTVDDHYQGVTDIVRGCDLLETTARQIHLRNVLKLSQPSYMHLPVAVDRSGQKLSKQTGAAALPLQNRSVVMFDALRALWQAPPSELRCAPISEQLRWAIENWDINHLDRITAVELDEGRNVCRRLRGPVATQQFNLQ